MFPNPKYAATGLCSPATVHQSLEMIHFETVDDGTSCAAAAGPEYDVVAVAAAAVVASQEMKVNDESAKLP